MNMKSKCIKIKQNPTQKIDKNWILFAYLLIFWCALHGVSQSQAAQTLVWDATTNTGPNDGSANWYDPNVWWSLTGGTNYTWSGGGDQENVIFGARTGSSGSYFVTNNVANLTQPITITFAQPGSYTITTDSSGDQGELQWVASGASVSTYSPGLLVTNGVSANINCPWRDVSGSDIVALTNSVLTFSQGTLANQSALLWIGAGSSVSTINLTNGTIGGPTGNFNTATMLADGVTLNISGAAILNAGTRFDIGRPISSGNPYDSVGDAVVNVVNGGSLNANATGQSNSGNHLQIDRSGSPGSLNITNGFVSTLRDSAGLAGNIRIVPDSSGRGTVNIAGTSTVNVGTGQSGAPGVTSANLTMITMFDATTPGANGQAILNVSGGTVTAKGISIGNGSAITSTATNQINVTGGTTYLDAANVVINTPSGTSGVNYGFNVSGGTIAATANWSPACKAPINLTNINGNITFQAADISGTAHNISLSGALTGVGGLTKTGGGVLAMGGANNYAGTTVVSNGTLSVSTIGMPTNGPVTLEGAFLSTGLPTNSVTLAANGQYWSMGNLTFDTGVPTADFNFQGLLPSTTIAPILVNGNLAFNVTPQVTIEGTAITSGTYPLIKYTGTLSGTPPPTLVSLPAGATSASIVNDVANHSIDLQIVSTIPAVLTWADSNGNWDFITPSWTQSGRAVDYADGDTIIFNDSASGTSPINITLNTSVSPLSISAQNTTKSYTISGTGLIQGSTGLTVSGAGGFALATVNTYMGGTAVSSPGLLNINNGGSSTASAIGTGPLTLGNLTTGGGSIGNTSGHAITLQTPNAELWNNNFTFVGSNNFDTGPGAITLGQSVVLTINTNAFEADGLIADGGSGYGIGLVGNGTLVLSNDNTFSGGLTLNGGSTLDLNESGADGSGVFTINGGTIDNTSGQTVTLTSSGYKWKGNFVVNGTTSLDLGAGSISVNAISLSVSNNTLFTEGAIGGANNTLNYFGPGTWTIGGSGANDDTLSMVINSGTVNFNKGFLWYADNSNPVTVETNGTLVMLNPTGTQMGPGSSIILSGGTVELNGDSQEVFSLIMFNSGMLRNSAGNAEFTLTSGLNLVGVSCDFAISNGASIEVDATITNTGSLLETGSGILMLTSNNTYTGSTTITGGTLALADPLAIGAGSISNTASIDIYDSAVLDVTHRSDQTLTLNSSQLLTGSGTINGNLVSSSGSAVVPGGSSTTGTLTVNNNVTLNGDLVLNLDRTNTSNCSQLASSGTITYGGILSVTNIGPTLHAGDTFQLFPSAVTTFSAINLATTDASGYVYTWNNSITTSGSVQVATVSPPINRNPGTIKINLSGNILNLAWPTNAGWYLQEQTNLLNTNWITIPGSDSVTTTNITVNPANSTLFFRLMYP